MHIFYIVLIAALITFGINGFIYQGPIIRRLRQLDAPFKADKMPSPAKAFFAIIFACTLVPLLGLCAMFSGMRHSMAIGFVNGFLKDRVVSEADAKEIYSWVIEKFPPTVLKEIN